MKNYFKLLTITFFALNSFTITFSQNWICGTTSTMSEVKLMNCSQSSTTYQNVYRKQSSYAPSIIPFIDTIIIPINIVILADNNGNGGAYTPATIINKAPYFDSINEAYLNTALPSDPVPGFPSSYWYTPQNNSRIRFIVNQVYFYNNTTYHNYTYPSSPPHNFDKINQLIAFHFTQNPEAKKQLNCYIVKNYDYISSAGYQHAYQNMPYILTRAGVPTPELFDKFYWTNHLPHELGHALGLMHTYAGGGAESNNPSDLDYLSDVILYEQSCNGGHAWSSYTDSCTNNLMGGKLNNFISPLQAGRAHRSLRLNSSLRHYAYGYSSVPHNITSNEIWDFEYKSYNNIVVKSGSTLTIKCRLEMVKDSKIIVEPNARLIVDGGIITSARSAGGIHDGLWQGIEVWGTSNQHQYPEAQPTYQGKLEIKNGGTISNAYLAAQNWKPDDYGKIGGVIISEGGVFKNNNRSVAFMTYENFNPSNSAIKRDNLSRFTNTEFVVNDDFIPATFGTHITMWQVYGINFYNCQFSNQITSKSYSAAHNKGIYSIDAGYRIYASCSTTPPFGTPCPSGNLLKSTFTGFNKAIEATGAGTTKTIAIDQAVFQNNLVGVDFNELDNFSVNRSTFMLGNPYGTSYFTFLLGITAANSSGFAMEENQFSRLAGYYGATYGIRVTDSGTENNRVYKNAFSSLYYGQYLIGINRNASNALKGLQFLCNSFDGNTRAVHVGNSVSTHGVRSYQGEYSPLKSAGNTFINVPSGGYSIYNASTWPISYYHSNGTTLPTSNTANVTTYYTSNANTCASSFSGGIMLASMLQHKSDSLSEIYDALEYNYLSLIDQGNTADFIQKINAEWSEDAWVLRNKLVAQAPYISQEALLEAIEQRVLPNAMVLEVCLANPDITKGEGFIEKLNDASESSLPEYMQNYIRQNWDEKTIRTTLEAQMASVAYEQSVVEHELISQVLVNEERSYDTILAVFSNKKGVQGKIDLLEFAIEQEKWQMADSVLTSVLTDPLLKDEQHHFNYYNEYIRFRISLNGRKLSQLDHSEITELESLAQLEGRVAGYARNILCFFYDICYESGENSVEKSMMAINPPMADKTLNELFYSVELYPNPSEDYSSMKWEILDLLDNCNYKIYDIKGIEMSRGIISTNKGETIIDTRTLPNGLYILTIENGGERKQSLKLAVTHNK